MAVDADTYGTVEKVEGLVSDIATGMAFSATSKPTIGEVEQFLDNTASELNVALTFAEYSIPVLLIDDKAAFNYLSYANSCGAAFLVLDALPAEAYTEPGQETPAQGRKQSLEKIFRRALKLVQDRKLPATKTSDGSLLSDLFIGSSEDSEGNTKKPIFTRGFADFPSSRSLTES